MQNGDSCRERVLAAAAAANDARCLLHIQEAGAAPLIATGQHQVPRQLLPRAARCCAIRHSSYSAPVCSQERASNLVLGLALCCRSRWASALRRWLPVLPRVARTRSARAAPRAAHGCTLHIASFDVHRALSCRASVVRARQALVSVHADTQELKSPASQSSRRAALAPLQVQPPESLAARRVTR